MAAARERWVLFDWGGTLMSEEGPADVPMALWPEVRAMEGAAETLAMLAANFRIGIATNASVSTRNMIEAALGRVGLRDWVADVFCYSDIGARKDEDAFWRAVLDRTGAEAAQLVMVGDSLEQDVVAPRSFGIAALWFNEGGRQPADPRGAPAIERLADAPPAVARLFAGAAR